MFVTINGITQIVNTESANIVSYDREITGDVECIECGRKDPTLKGVLVTRYHCSECMKNNNCLCTKCHHPLAVTEKAHNGGSGECVLCTTIAEWDDHGDEANILPNELPQKLRNRLHGI